MKKIVVLFLAVSAVMMGSCSKEGNSSETNGSLIGTWVTVRNVFKKTKNGQTTVNDKKVDFEKCEGAKVTFEKTQGVSTNREKDSNDNCNEDEDIFTYVYENGRIITTDDKGKKDSVDVIKLNDSELVIFSKSSETYQGNTYEYENTIYFKRVK